MKFNVGDKVRVKDTTAGDPFPSGAFGTIIYIDTVDKPSYKVVISGRPYWCSEDILEPHTAKTYEQGLVDAWELARKIAGHINKGSFTMQELRSIFGNPFPASVLEEFTAEEALTKIKDYEGNTLSTLVENSKGTRAVVLTEQEEATYTVLTENGGVEHWIQSECISIKEESTAEE